MSASGRIPAYYINLASRPDRRAFMEDQFARFGMAVERIEAVTTSDVGEDRMAPHLDPHNRTAMSQVEVACLLSHERTWRAFLETGEEHAMILEDDLVMSEGLPHFLDRALHQELGVDLMKLETFRQSIRLGRARQVVAGRWAVRQLLTSHLGTAAYIISRTRAQRALADPVAHTMPVDCYLFDKRGPLVPARGIFQVEPAPAVQLHLHCNAASAEVSRSDLAAERARVDASRPSLASHRRRQAIARLKYKLRTIIQTYQDIEAVRTKRRLVPFEGDPTEPIAGGPQR